MRMLIGLALSATVAVALATSGLADQPRRSPFDQTIRENGERLWERGRQIFRYDTFGDEAFRGGALKLHQAIAGQRLGGVGPDLAAVVEHYNRTFTLNLV